MNHIDDDDDDDAGATKRSIKNCISQKCSGNVFSMKNSQLKPAETALNQLLYE